VRGATSTERFPRGGSGMTFMRTLGTAGDLSSGGSQPR
jgi:hypothetical protein